MIEKKVFVFWVVVSVVHGCDLGEEEMKLRSGPKDSDGEEPCPGRETEPCVCEPEENDMEQETPAGPAESTGSAAVSADSESAEETDRTVIVGEDSSSESTGFDSDSQTSGTSAQVGEWDTVCGSSSGDSYIDMDAGVTNDTEETGAAGCLIISEYLEGSSNNKALELFNCQTEPLELGPYSVCRITNQDTDCSTSLPLEGTLAPGAVKTICHTKAEIFSDQCDIRSGLASFNGDDRLAVMWGHEIVDAFGELTKAPADLPWADITYRRCSREPFLGDTQFDVDDYYTKFEIDDASHLGLPPSSWPCDEEQGGRTRPFDYTFYSCARKGGR